MIVVELRSFGGNIDVPAETAEKLLKAVETAFSIEGLDPSIKNDLPLTRLQSALRGAVRRILFLLTEEGVQFDPKGQRARNPIPLRGGLTRREESLGEGIEFPRTFGILKTGPAHHFYLAVSEVELLERLVWETTKAFRL